LWGLLHDAVVLKTWTIGDNDATLLAEQEREKTGVTTAGGNREQ